MVKGRSDTESEIIEIINNNCGTIDYDQVGTPEAEYHLGISWSQGEWPQSGSNVYVGGTFTAGLGFGVWSWARTYTLTLPC